MHVNEKTRACRCWYELPERGGRVRQRTPRRDCVSAPKSVHCRGGPGRRRSRARPPCRRRLSIRVACGQTESRHMHMEQLEFLIYGVIVLW